MRNLALVLSLALAGAALPTIASGAQYPGSSDTGWSWYDKSDCCAEAIALAQEDSMFRCERAGGFPSARFGLRRGNCQWRYNVDAYGDRVYRCWGEARVTCN